MTCDIFIRSYSGDFDWLSYCLRSIQRFATGFRQVVVIVPNGHEPPTGTLERVFRVAEHGDQYMQQQSDKLHADAFSDADYLLYMDSDTIFTRSITPEDAIAPDGRARWLYTPYASLGNDESQLWRNITSKALRQPVEYEFMRRHPLCAQRWALEGVRAWFWREHGMSLERYIMSQPGHEFSEWNALGAWLWLNHRERIEWINTDEQMGVPFVHQSHSWGGLSDAIRANLEAAIA